MLPATPGWRRQAPHSSDPIRAPMSGRHDAALGGRSLGVSAGTLVAKPLLNVTAAVVTLLAGGDQILRAGLPAGCS